MGTGLRPLLTVLFHMIPRLPPTHSTRKCATPTIPGTRKHRQADTPVRSRCLHRLRRTRASGSSTSPPSPPRTTTTQTLTPVSDVMTHHKLDAEPDRSQAGVQPISTRVATDLKAEPDRSRRGVRPISARSARSASTIEAQYNTSPPVHAAVTRDDATPPCRWSQISSSSTAGTSLARRTASTSSSGS